MFFKKEKEWSVAKIEWWLINEIKEDNFKIVIDSLGFDSEIWKSQINIVKEKSVIKACFYFDFKTDFVMHLLAMK